MTTLRDGAYPVMLLPLHDDASIDWPTLDRYTDWLIERGSAGLFPVALSGEMYELDEEERLAVAQAVVARSAGRVPVVAAVAERGDARRVAEAVGRMAATGVDAVVLIASLLLDEAEDESALMPLVDAVLTANPGVALGVYECPLPYHRLLSTDAVAALAATGRFVFFKETSHDVERMRDRVRAAAGTPLRVLDAGIETLLESRAVGVAGLSGWIVNVYPDLVEHLVREPSAPSAVELRAALVAAEQSMGPGYPGSAKALVELRAGIGLRSTSRWRPASVRPDAVREQLRRVEKSAASAGVQLTVNSPG